MLISKDIEIFYIEKRNADKLYNELFWLRRSLEVEENFLFYREYPEISELMDALKRSAEDQ